MRVGNGDCRCPPYGPATTVSELVALAEANPGKVTLAVRDRLNLSCGRK